MVRRRRRGGDPLRRRDQRRRRDRASGRRRLHGGGDDRPRRPRPGARGRSHLPRGPDPGRDAGAVAERSARRARPHPAPLPAVVRVLEPRRLDRDQGGGPLRHRLDPHRRPGRVGAGDHPVGGVGEPPAARLGRRPEPGPAADRLRGDPRPDHRSVGAGARAPAPQALGRDRLRLVRRRREGGQGAVAIRTQPGQLPVARRGRGRAHPRRRRRPLGAGARLRVGARPRRRIHGPGAGAGSRPRRRGHVRAKSHEQRATRRRRRRLFVAARLPRGAVPARHVRRLRGALGDLRDSDHLGSLRAAPRDRDRDRPPRGRRGLGRGRRGRRGAEGDVPVHPRLPGRPGALLHHPRARSPRLGGRAVGRDQGRGLGRADRPPARRSPTTTRSAAITGRGTTASDRSRSPTRCARPSAHWILRPH